MHSLIGLRICLRSLTSFSSGLRCTGSPYRPQLARDGRRRASRAGRTLSRRLPGNGVFGSSSAKPGCRRLSPMSGEWLGRASVPLEDLAQGQNWRMCEALLTLHLIADEACAGLFVALDRSDGYGCLYRARGREVLARTGSL
jgi:hypothetical protein